MPVCPHCKCSDANTDLFCTCICHIPLNPDDIPLDEDSSGNVDPGLDHGDDHKRNENGS